MRDREEVSAEVYVRPANDGYCGYDIIVQPLTRERMRRIGPFARFDVAMVWARVVAEERRR